MKRRHVKGQKEPTLEGLEMAETVEVTVLVNDVIEKTLET